MAHVSGQVVSPALLAWGAAHDKLDQVRKEEEEKQHLKQQYRLDAVNKLTPEEREALGLTAYVK